MTREMNAQCNFTLQTGTRLAVLLHAMNEAPKDAENIFAAMRDGEPISVACELSFQAQLERTPAMIASDDAEAQIRIGEALDEVGLKRV